jgi:hypothetical protein
MCLFVDVATDVVNQCYNNDDVVFVRACLVVIPVCWRWDTRRQHRSSPETICVRTAIDRCIVMKQTRVVLDANSLEKTIIQLFRLAKARIERLVDHLRIALHAHQNDRSSQSIGLRKENENIEVSDTYGESRQHQVELGATFVLRVFRACRQNKSNKSTSTQLFRLCLFVRLVNNNVKK